MVNKNIFIFLFLIWGSHSSLYAQFINIGTYNVKDIGIDCFDKAPHILFQTKEIGLKVIDMPNKIICHQYLTNSHPGHIFYFYDCDTDKILNRFILSEDFDYLSHEIIPSPEPNCSEESLRRTKDFLKSMTSV